MERVALIKGPERLSNVKRSLELISDLVVKKAEGRQVVIKPNFVSTTNQLASSHVDQVRGILDFFRAFHSGDILVAEAACGDTGSAFDNFGYRALCSEYGVELVDLNDGPFETVSVASALGETLMVRVASLLLDHDNYLVSAAKLKTHDTVVVTLSIKNMAMGGVLWPDKKLVHQGLRLTNLNLAELARRLWPDLSVIDGMVGMEGSGPTHGDPVEAGVALSGTDPLAVDRVACEIMGIPFKKVGYLVYCADMGLGASDLDEIELRGSSLDECVTPFRLHPRVQEQYQWKAEGG